MKLKTYNIDWVRVIVIMFTLFMGGVFITYVASMLFGVKQ
jgi:cbb3-type cytochrome oxidase subunit 3